MAPFHTARTYAWAPRVCAAITAAVLFLVAAVLLAGPASASAPEKGDEGDSHRITLKPKPEKPGKPVAGYGHDDDDDDDEGGSGRPSKPVQGDGDDDDESEDDEQPNVVGAGNAGSGNDNKVQPQAQPSAPANTPAATTQPQSPIRTGAGSQQRPSRRTQRSDRPRGGRRGAAGGDSSGGVGGATGSGAPLSDAAGASGPTSSAGGGPDAGDAGGSEPREGSGRSSGADEGNSPVSPVTRTVTRTVRDIVEVVPDSVKAALGGLAALAVLLGAGYLFAAVRARRLARQRRELLQEVGLLQGALLPAVPAALGALRTSVAYRPAEGPGAGGDFYDVIALSGGRVGFILGDVSGHGRGALARTAFMRYTLRAYLEAGLEPRVALQVADRVIDENLDEDFATVLLAVHDPDSGALTYASAGHPGPILIGPEPYEPVTAASSPPIGAGVRTGLRQTTVPLPSGSLACLYTDGLSEARTEDGILGRERLAELVAELGDDATAEELLDRIAERSRILSDDMATCLIAPTSGVTSGSFRTEQLEVSAAELEGPLAGRFLEACGVPAAEAEAAQREARATAEQFGGAVLHVVLGNRRSVEVLPRNVESIEAASRRMAAAAG